MNFLDFIPAQYFEVIGLIAGLSASVTIAFQVKKEYQSDEPSSLSLGYLIGWGLIFIFWGLYGIRFDAKALWITNGLATIAQGILLMIVMRKKKQ